MTDINTVLQHPKVLEAIKAQFGSDTIKSIQAENVNVKSIITGLTAKSRAELLQMANYLTALMSEEVQLDEDYLAEIEADPMLGQLSLLSEVDQIKVLKKIFAHDSFKLKKGGGRKTKPEPANPLIDEG